MTNPISRLGSFFSAGGRGLALLVAACLALFFQSACSTENGPPGPGNGEEEPADAGEPCPSGDPMRCATGVSLIGQGGQCWCSAFCESEQDCPDDFPCQRYEFDGDHRDVCAPLCTTDVQCASGSCDAQTGACDPPLEGSASVGDSCGDDAGMCSFGLVCVRHGGPGRCMEMCGLHEGPLCESGAVCYEATVPDGGICWLGGELAFDTPCSGEFDCVIGHVCVAHVGGQTCRPACDMEAPDPCEEGTGSCRALYEGRLGACLP